jgi:hypothetical protein
MHPDARVDLFLFVYERGLGKIEAPSTTAYTGLQEMYVITQLKEKPSPNPWNTEVEYYYILGV